MSFSSADGDAPNGGGAPPHHTTVRPARGQRYHRDSLGDEDDDIGLKVWGEGKEGVVKSRNKDGIRSVARRRRNLNSC